MGRTRDNAVQAIQRAAQPLGAGTLHGGFRAAGAGRLRALPAPADQFDAVVHLDQTRALRPLEHEHPWEHTEEPGTYPSGL